MTLSSLALLTLPAALAVSPGVDPFTLENQIDALSALYEQHTRRTLASRVITGEVIEDTGRRILRLTVDHKAAMPVTAMTALTFSGPDGTLLQTVTLGTWAGDVFTPIIPSPVRIDRATGRVTLYTTGGWSPGGFATVTFTAGFTLADYPAERALLARAVLVGLQWLRSREKRDPQMTMVRDENITIAYATGGQAGGTVAVAQLPEPIQLMLQPFVWYPL